MLFFFFKQKTAYEMRISDWSSDVCSSDLLHDPGALCLPQPLIFGAGLRPARQSGDALHIISALRDPEPCDQARSVGHARLNGRMLVRIAVEAKREPAVGPEHHLPPVERHRYGVERRLPDRIAALGERPLKGKGVVVHPLQRTDDRKSTRLNSSH